MKAFVIVSSPTELIRTVFDIVLIMASAGNPVTARSSLRSCRTCSGIDGFP